MLLTCTPYGWEKLRGYRKFKDKVGFMKVKEINQTILLQMFQSITLNILLEVIDAYAYNQFLKTSANWRFYVVAVENINHENLGTSK